MEAIINSAKWGFLALAYIGLICLVARCMSINGGDEINHAAND